MKQSNETRGRRILKGPLKTVAVAFMGTVLIAGCAVTPEPITDEERISRASTDLQALFADQEELAGPISMAEAMARAVKYNLDHRVKLLEKVVINSELDVARMDLLPEISARAGYTRRSNVLASSSESLETGLESLEPSTSQERARDLADIAAVWNVLDFGVAYVTAKQRTDQILIAEERRRKAVQNIVQDVRVAYWQAMSAAELSDETEVLIADTREALGRSRNLEKQGLQSPETALLFQQRLLATLRQLLQLRQQLSVSRTELASLMNLRPGTEYDLMPAEMEIELPVVETDVNELEEFALQNRPEVREEDYRLRISSQEVKKAMLRMLPGVEIEAGVHYDSNDFLVNNSWSDAGLRISWNLFNLFAGPANKRRAEAQVELDNTRRLAVSMAVLTQIQVAYQRYFVAMKDYELSNELFDVLNNISEQTRTRRLANVGDELTEIRSRADALVAKMQRAQAVAELQNAVGRIHNSIGLDPLPAEVQGYEVATLTQAIAAHQQELNSALVQPSLDPEEYGKISAAIAAARDEAEREAQEVALQKARAEAIAAKAAAEEEARIAAAEQASREAAAAAATEAALAAQQRAIEAALDQAEANRLAEEEAARQAEIARQAAEVADQARLAAEAAAEQARQASEQAAARQQALDEAEAARQEEAARIAASAKSELEAALQATLDAGAAKELASQAEASKNQALEKASGIIIPDAPASE